MKRLRVRQLSKIDLQEKRALIFPYNLLKLVLEAGKIRIDGYAHIIKDYSSIYATPISIREISS